jgi:hypothetical protein
MGNFLVNTGESVPLEEFDEKKAGMIPVGNKILDVGAAYLEALMFDNQNGNWCDEGTWLHPTYIHVGTSNDTNLGTLGPTTIVPVEVGSGWSAASRLDYKMSAWAAASQLSYRQVGTQVVAKAIFTDAQLFPGEDTSISIRELGLGLDDEEPAASPLEDSNEMEHAMIARAVRYSLTTISGTQYYTDNPIPWLKSSGTNLEVFYTFRMQ